MAKGISTRPVAKRINKLPLIIFLSLLMVVVLACFYVVTQRQKKLQNNATAGPVMETAPINADTQTPDFLGTAYLKELDEKNGLVEKQVQQKVLQQGDVKAPELEKKQVDQITANQTLVKAENVKQTLEKPFQPYYQATQPPPMPPQKSEAQIFREKVASQKREAAFKAQKASTLISIGAAATQSQQQTPPSGTFARNSQYPQPTMVVPQNEKPDQAQKKDFLTTAQEQKVSLANAYREAVSPFELKQGHLIPMTLITKINSDLPGSIKAQVTENVYDTATGNHLLIPQGTMINGIYDSRVVFGQKRVLIAWQRLIFPDASTLNVGSMPGTDREGAAGVKDLVDNHYFQIFGAAILMSVVNAGFTMASETDNQASDKETAQDALTKSAAQQMQQTFSRMIDKIMNIQPELVIRQGKQGHIILTKDVIGLQPYNPAQKPTYFLKTAEIQ
jgi:type IV secretion system protein TrbI